MSVSGGEGEGGDEQMLASELGSAKDPQGDVAGEPTIEKQTREAVA